MNAIGPKLIVAALVAIALLASGSADARRHRRQVDQASTNISVDASGTPIIMKGFHADQARIVPRVQTPVAVPPPHTGLPDLPPRQLLQTSPPPVYAAPSSKPSFSDRVTNCIHSFPLNAGIGNNPTDQTAYIGQCVNQ